MHSYWDSHVVNLAMRRDDEATFVARLFEALPVMPGGSINSGDADLWPQQWADDGLVHSKTVHNSITILAYPWAPTIRAERRTAGAFSSQQGYDERARTVVRLQLAKGGYRLAAVLKAILAR